MRCGARVEVDGLLCAVIEATRNTAPGFVCRSTIVLDIGGVPPIVCAACAHWEYVRCRCAQGAHEIGSCSVCSLWAASRGSIDGMCAACKEHGCTEVSDPFRMPSASEPVACVEDFGLLGHASEWDWTECLAHVSAGQAWDDVLHDAK